MHVWVVGGHLFGPVLRRVDMAAGAGAHFAPLWPVIPDLTAIPGQKIISALRKRQRVVASGTGANEVAAATQHEIQPQLRARIPALGCHCSKTGPSSHP